MLINTKVRKGYVFYQFLGNKQINIKKVPVRITSGFVQLEHYVGKSLKFMVVYKIILDGYGVIGFSKWYSIRPKIWALIVQYSDSVTS